ncbi:hypothetical protein HYV43_05895 [Candidatus Micrarchaeota archaeon]|nr:hypothetical protein [Candidatus Micrarchaeota archaeon]
MVSVRRPFHFYPRFLGSGRFARTYTLPEFVRHDQPLSTRLPKFESHARDQLNRFFNFRGAFLPVQMRNESNFIREQLWHTRALLGFLEDKRIRTDLKNGKIPTLVRFERPHPRSLMDRIIQNVPLFGVSAASLISMGVPLPWNMVGGSLATAVREYAEDFRSHRDFENGLRQEFKKTGRDPEPYLRLYRHLDAIIPHPLGHTAEPLPLALRLENFKQLNAFHSKLEELHHFATGYLEGLDALQRAVSQGYSRNNAIDMALKEMTVHIHRAQEVAESMRQGKLVPLEVQGDPLERVRTAPMVQEAEASLLRACRSRKTPSPRKKRTSKPKE